MMTVSFKDDPICSRCLRRSSRHAPGGKDQRCPDGFVARIEEPRAARPATITTVSADLVIETLVDLVGVVAAFAVELEREGVPPEVIGQLREAGCHVSRAAACILPASTFGALPPRPAGGS